jgi:hypothetical protein
VRVIPMPAPPAQPLTPVPATPGDRESAAVTWCRDIATAVATALDSEAEQIGYRLTPRPGLPAPHTLHTTFTVAGPARRHTVRAAAVWDDLWREPGFALTVDDQPVALDGTSPQRAAVVLAHAAWQAITDADTVDRPAGPVVGVR